MKIAVLGGGGAMGGLFGGYLARAGEDVVLVDVSHASIDAIDRDGLAIEEKDGSTATIRVKASSKPKDVGPVDLIVNFVKCYHTEAAISAASPMLGEGYGDPDASERLGQCRSHCGAGGQIARDGRAYLSFRDAARPRPRQAFGNWNDPRGRARRLFDRRVSKPRSRPFAKPASRRRPRRASSTRYGRSSL